jgi:hypothetical protein
MRVPGGTTDSQLTILFRQDILLLHYRWFLCYSRRSGGSLSAIYHYTQRTLDYESNIETHTISLVHSSHLILHHMYSVLPLTQLTGELGNYKRQAISVAQHSRMSPNISRYDA